MHYWGLLLLAVLWLTQPAISDVIEESRFHGNYRNLDTRLTNEFRGDKCDENNHLNRAPDIRLERRLEDRHSIRSRPDARTARLLRVTSFTPDNRYIRQELRRVELRASRNEEDARDIRREFVRNDIRRNDDRREQTRLTLEKTGFENYAKDTGSDVRRQVRDESRRLTIGDDMLRTRGISDGILNIRDGIYRDAEKRLFRFTAERRLTRDRIEEHRPNDFSYAKNIDSRDTRPEVAISRRILRKDNDDMRRVDINKEISRLVPNARYLDSRNVELRKQSSDRFVRTKRNIDTDELRQQKRELLPGSDNGVTASIQGKSEQSILKDIRDNNRIRDDTSFLVRSVRSADDTRKDIRARVLTVRRTERDISLSASERHLRSSTEATNRHNSITERRNASPDIENNRRVQTQRHTDGTSTRLNKIRDQTDVRQYLTSRDITERDTRFETVRGKDKTRFSAERITARSENLARSVKSTLTQFNGLPDTLTEAERRSCATIDSRTQRLSSRDARSGSFNRRTTESLNTVCSSESQFLLNSPEYQKDRHIKSRLIRTAEHRNTRNTEQLPLARNMAHRDVTRHSFDRRHVRNSAEERLTRIHVHRQSVNSESKPGEIMSSRPNARSRSITSKNERDDTPRSRNIHSERDDSRRSQVELMSSRSNARSQSIIPTNKHDDTLRSRFVNSERGKTRRSQERLLSSRSNSRSRSIETISERDNTRQSRFINSEHDRARRSREVLVASRFNSRSRSVESVTERDNTRQSRSIDFKRDDTRRSQFEFSSSRLNARSRSIVPTIERDDTRRSRSTHAERDDTRLNQVELRSSRVNAIRRSILSTTVHDDTLRSRSIHYNDRDDARRNQEDMRSTSLNIRGQSCVSTTERDGALRRQSINTGRDNTYRIRSTNSERGETTLNALSRTVSNERDDTRRDRVDMRLTRLNIRERPDILKTERDDTRSDNERQYNRTSVQKLYAEETTRLPTDRNDVRNNIDRRSPVSKRDVKSNERLRVSNQIRRTHSLERDIRNRQKIDKSSAELRFSRREVERRDTRPSTERYDRYLTVDHSGTSARFESRGSNQLIDFDRRISEREDTRSRFTRTFMIRGSNNRDTTHHATALRDNVRNIAKENTDERRSYTNVVRVESRPHIDMAREDNRRNNGDKLTRSTLERESRRNVDQNNRYSTTLDNRRIGKAVRSVDQREDTHRISREDNRRNIDDFTRTVKDEQLSIRRSHENKQARLITDRVESERGNYEVRKDRFLSLRSISPVSELGNTRRSTERRTDNFASGSRNILMVVRATERSDVEDRRVFASRLGPSDLRQTSNRRSTNAVSSSLYITSLTHKPVDNRRNLQADSRTQMKRQLNPVLENENIITIENIYKDVEGEHILNWQHLFYIVQAGYLLGVLLLTRMDKGADKFKTRSWRGWRSSLNVKLD